MAALTMLAGLGLFVYGWIAGGILGALTGGATGFLAGAGLQLAARSSPPGMLPQPLVGLGLAFVTILAAVQGGWKWGWLWAIGAYLAAMFATMLVNIMLVRSGAQR
jgi:hypothetical protein